ncbi:arginyl-tRNA synthetase [Lasiosphaeria ovina]|uniref:arginine--tRNA ligase n=1 Tax=Lasiosphaeria ovina TaxID=92902 RepID=A0AAE0JVX6_9PEZI|nr:arginyl-tRNA synthetase [Lasiosphaeria ovina]
MALRAKFPACYPDSNPLDEYRAHIAQLLSQISGIDQHVIYPVLHRANVLENGDLVLPVPALRVKPKEEALLAEQWASERGQKDPKDPSQGKKRMVVEFSSPKIANPFHASHLRSTIVGGFLSNLYEAMGWDVYGLLALGYERYGDQNALAVDPIGHLFSLYVKINAELVAEAEEIKRLGSAGQDVSKLRQEGLDEQGRRYFRVICDQDNEAIGLWERFRALTVERYETLYERLNIRFDEYLGESKVKPESMKVAEDEMAASGLTEVSDDAVMLDFKKHLLGKEGKRLLENGPDSQARRHEPMIYVVASDQDLHMRRLFKIIDLTGHKELRAKVSYISFGLVLGMSTRRGTVKFLDDILCEVGGKMHSIMQRNEVKYSMVEDPEKTADDMSGKRASSYRFDMDTTASFEGDTAEELVPMSEIASADLSLLKETRAVNISEPCTVLSYLFRLTHALRSSYDVLRVISSEMKLMKARLALYHATRIVLRTEMKIIGLSPVERTTIGCDIEAQIYTREDDG